MMTLSKLINYSKLHLFGIELVFIELSNYYKAMEDFLDTKKIKFEQKFSKENFMENAKDGSEFPNDYKNFLLDEYSKRYWELGVLYPHNFRASFLTQIISFIEFELKKICDHHQALNKITFGVSDLKGYSDIEKCKKYLAKVCSIDFVKLEPEWKFIDDAKTIRNKIIHHQGTVNSKDNDFKRVDNFVKSEQGLKYKEDSFSSSKFKIEDFTILICGKEFCERLLKMTELFFKKLLNDQLKYIS